MDPEDDDDDNDLMDDAIADLAEECTRCGHMHIAGPYTVVCVVCGCKEGIDT